MPFSRRKFLGTALTASASGLIAPTAAPSTTPDLLILSSPSLLVAIDRNTGCLHRLESKDGAWRLQGAGLRLHVPAPDHRFHYLNESHSAKPRIESDNQLATITWSGFLSPRMGKLDIEVQQTIRLEGVAVQFTYKIRNSSPAVIESYAYPRLAGLKPPAGDKTLQQAAWNYSGMGTAPLWPTFGNEVGYYGYDTPAQLRNLGADSQFCLILAETRGLYLGYHDPAQKQVVQICFALSPSYVDSYNSSVLASGKASDSAVALDPNHLCFIQPGASQSSEALVLTPFTGDWHAGADIYKAWRATWLKAPVMPAWVKDVHSWQQIQINSSEDRLEFPYKDLLKVAEACQRWGVKAIQLTGWQNGGQDRDFPLHDTDPRLGSPDEFKQAIAESRKLGVEIVLFNKYAWADVTAPAYATEFRKFAIEDPYGDPRLFNGYNYDTPTQIGGINTRHGAGMCQASPPWRQRALIEFQKSVALGASGILFDECQWHISPYCFSPHHGHAVPGAVFSGDVPLIEGFRTVIDPEQFLFAGESPYDLELRTYDMSYIRINRGFVPFARYLAPFAPMSVAVTGYNDRQMINACLLYRFSMSYEPRDFHGYLDEIPLTLTYGRAIDDLRRKYRDWLWDAEFRDTEGARVTANGAPHNTYTVFHRNNGLRAVVLANMSDTAPILCELALDPPAKATLSYVTPEQPSPQPWPGKFQLPPGFAAVVLEG